MRDRRPLATVTAADGRPVAMVTAAADGSPDPFLAAVVAAYVARETAAAVHRAAVRAGTVPPSPPAGRWLITDRD